MNTTTRKIPTTVVILAACVLGVAIGLFGLNFWHAAKCSGDHKSNEQVDDYIAVLERRILEAESQAYKNEIMLSKVISALQSKLLTLETKEIDLINKESADEAVRLALTLSQFPPPPVPLFEMDDNYRNAEKLADAVDDVFSQVGRGEETFKDDFSSGRMDDNEQKLAITDKEAEDKCQEWKEKYQVAVGVSWGNLPYDLQQQWLTYSCDYHLKI